MTTDDIRRGERDGITVLTFTRAREIDRLAQTTLFMSDDYRDRVNAFNAASAARQSQPSEGGA
jgi:hypothetical protein